MTVQSRETPLTAQAFVEWSEIAPGDTRSELLDGLVYTMASERAVHARVKNAMLREFERAIAASGLPCEAFPDGMAVKVDETNVFEPDVTVRCGPRLGRTDVLILDPLIVVEVASPSTQRIDVLVKLGRYFRNSSLMHYLILVPTGGVAIHHRRRADGQIEVSSHEGGSIRFQPPGLEVDLSVVFASQD